MTDQSPKPGWTEKWNAKSAVDKRLTQDAAKKKFMSVVLFFALAPFIGGALIMIGQQNWLWIPGALIMVVGVLGWMIGPFVIGGGIIYAVFNTMKPDAAATFAGPAAAATPTGIDETTDAELAPILAQLDTLRHELARQRRAALTKVMPVIAVIVLLLCYWIIQSSGFNLIPIALVLTLPLFFGMHFISAPFQSQFRERFKTDVLPSLLARHGDWRRRNDYSVDLSGSAAVSVVPTHRIVQVDDAFTGTHRAVPIDIADLVLLNPARTTTAMEAPESFDTNQKGQFELTKVMIRAPRSGRNDARKTAHRLLLISLTLDRPVPARTAVVDSRRDKSLFAGIDDAMQRVELEDVVFNSVYQVYSTDQVGARALLTPAVMRRLIEVADGKDFLPPTLYARDNKMLIFLATYNERDLFEPGTVAVADMGSHVRAIDRDLTNAFAIADTVIDMAAGLSTRPITHGDEARSHSSE